ncbi:MAG: hypothetical protein WC223_03120 [Bacteroidales bacterium]|jgi:hypothetical protein
MEKRSINTKKILLGFLLLVLISPYIQSTLKIFNENPLKGDIIIAPDTVFTIKGWFDARYQLCKEKYLNEDFGFRKTAVRINNQIAFSLYKIAKANGVIIGKNNYLYEKGYINAYYGEDFIGEEKIAEQTKRIKFLQDTLKKLNKDLILIFAAGKGSFYPEYIPDRVKSEKKQTNLECYLKYSKELGINFIDFNSYFVANKNKSKYPLYPQYGIHWSSYGVCLAIDSIIKYIEQKRNIKMINFYWNDIELPDTCRDADYDIADGMNLLFKLKTFKMAYPKYIFEENPNKTKPKVLVIADSYYWGMFGIGVSRRIFNDGEFWFYNRQINPERTPKPLDVSQINLKEEIEKQDAIIIMATEANISNFGWGFIENAYDVFLNNGENIIYKEKIKNFENGIRSNPEWLKFIAKQANKSNISLDSAIKLNAIWTVEHEKK